MKRVRWNSEWNKFTDFLKSQSQYKIIKALYEEKEFEFMSYKELKEKTRLSKLSLTRNLNELCEKDPREVALLEEMKHSKVPKIPKWILSHADQPPFVMRKNGIYKLHPRMRKLFDKSGNVGLATLLGGKRPKSHTPTNVRDEVATKKESIFA